MAEEEDSPQAVAEATAADDPDGIYIESSYKMVETAMDPERGDDNTAAISVTNNNNNIHDSHNGKSHHKKTTRFSTDVIGGTTTTSTLVPNNHPPRREMMMVNNKNNNMTSSTTSRRNSSSSTHHLLQPNYKGPFGEMECCHRTCLAIGCPNYIIKRTTRYPRFTGCCCGMILPLIVLIFISYLLGFILAGYEYSNELTTNDQILRDHGMLNYSTAWLGTLITTLPETCLELWVEGNRTTNEIESALDGKFDFDNLNTTVGDIIPITPSTTTTTDLNGTSTSTNTNNNTITSTYIDPEEGTVAVKNYTLFSTFMSDCGYLAYERAQAFREEFALLAPGPMTFNWNRCVNETSIDWTGPVRYHKHFILTPTEEQIEGTRYTSQVQYYTTLWKERQQETYQIIFDSLYLQLIQQPEYQTGKLELPDSTDVVYQSIQWEAFETSLELTTANDTCVRNVPAAGWFWFTIMTTVGYGNQAPVSWEGRILVYTLGFLSILAFGAILSTSGTIVNVICRDTLKQLGFYQVVNRPSLLAILWGTIWYSWMFAIAHYTVIWFKRRTGEIYSPSQAYWFAYISTTTIGLGDYYPPPEVLFFGDLLMFSILFLFGFVWLSAFLGEFTAALSDFFPDIGDQLAQELHDGEYDENNPLNKKHEKHISNDENEVEGMNKAQSVMQKDRMERD